MGVAIQHLLSGGRDAVDQEHLFDFLITRAMILTKLSRPKDAMDDLDKAVRISSAFKDEFLQRSLRSIALLQKGYVLMTIANEPMEALFALNESLSLNPCANLDGAIHAKLIYSIRENNYYDEDDWLGMVSTFSVVAAAFASHLNGP